MESDVQQKSKAQSLPFHHGGGKTKVHIPAKTHFIISKKRLHVAEDLDW